jgi:hypothetical protein
VCEKVSDNCVKDETVRDRASNKDKEHEKCNVIQAKDEGSRQRNRKKTTATTFTQNTIHQTANNYNYD